MFYDLININEIKKGLLLVFSDTIEIYRRMPLAAGTPSKSDGRGGITGGYSPTGLGSSFQNIASAVPCRVRTGRLEPGHFSSGIEETVKYDVEIDASQSIQLGDLIVWNQKSITLNVVSLSQSTTPIIARYICTENTTNTL